MIDLFARTPELEGVLYDEDFERIWIPYEHAATAGKAKYIAYTGHGLPAGFNEAGFIRFPVDLKVRVVRMRNTEATRMPPGWWNSDYPWHKCKPDDPGARKFWCVYV